MAADTKVLKHGARSAFDPAMILFDQAVQILGGSQLRLLGQQSALSHLTHCSMRCGIAVEGDRVRWSTLMPHCLLEEGLCCGYISRLAEPEVNSMPSLVHRSIQVGPLPAYLDIGLVHSPGAAPGLAKAVPALDEL